MRHGSVREAGVVLLAVLVLLFIVGASSVSFIWFMNQQQVRAGARYQSAAALALAEAGVHRALSILETVAPDDGRPGRAWRPAAYSEPVAVGSLAGRFTLSLVDDADGAILLTSTGETARTARTLRVRAYLASTALLSALHAESFVRVERPHAVTVILPYGAGLGDRPWFHIAAGRGIWFVTSGVSLNDASVPVEAGAGPVDASIAASASRLPHPEPMRFLLGPGADLMVDQGLRRIGGWQLRPNGVAVDGVVFQSKAFAKLPDVDRSFYRGLAAANTSGARLNQAAGQYFGDESLARKRDSLYTQSEFDRLLAYLQTGLHAPPLSGIVYVQGPISLSWGQRLQVTDGALIAEGTVDVGQGATLEVTHTGATRTLPGVIVLDGGLVITQEARLQAHGLVYASGMIEVSEGAQLDIVGSVLAGDPGLSFHNFAGAAVIRYDPAVLGTPGLRVPPDAPVVGWVASWTEVP